MPPHSVQLELQLFFLHPSDAQHGDLGVVQPNDVLLLISNSGKTREIVELVELADNLYPNLPILVITGNEESELAQMADAVLFTGNPAEVCTLGLTPSTSTTTMDSYWRHLGGSVDESHRIYK